MPDVWFVTNGYRGNGFVTAIVMAEDEEEALDRGKAALLAENERMPARVRHDPEHYGHDLKAERVTLPYVTEIG